MSLLIWVISFRFKIVYFSEWKIANALCKSNGKHLELRVGEDGESSITHHHSDKEICLSINNFIVIENSIEDKSLNSMRIFGKYWIYVLRCNLNGALILRGLFTVNVNLHSDLHAVTLWSDCVVTAKIRVYSSSTGSNNRFDYVKFIERCVLAVVTQSNEG